MEKKVYDYKADKVKAGLQAAFKRRGREATVADLVAETALPRIQVDEQLPAVADEFGARLKVTESGEILYSFPRGMKSRYRGLGPSLKRGLAAFKKAAAAVLSFLFKIWIVAMLVGYFVLFLTLLVLFIVGGIAVQASDRGGRSRRGGMDLIGGILNAFIRIWFYSELTRGPRADAARYRGRDAQKKRPLHKAIFSFVFGDGDPNADWPTVERKAVLAYLRRNSGIISLEEFMILSGRESQDASEAMNAYCLEFEGSPEVSEEGAIFYRFASIMKGVDVVGSPVQSSALAKAKSLVPFSSNPKSANVWFGVMNGINLVFGGFFLYGTAVWGPGALDVILSRVRVASLGILHYFYLFVVNLAGILSADPVALVAIVLGMVPLAFAALFYLVPFLRKAGLAKRNEEIKKENLRRIVYGQAWDNPDAVRPPSAQALPEMAKPKAADAAAKALDELAAYSAADISSEGGANVYSFPELKRTKAALAKLRGSTDRGEFKLGGVVFDTDAPGDK
jgi:hypothetical protein